MEKMVTTGIRTSPARLEKLDRIATQLGTTRNRVWNLLVDNAEIVSQPVVNAALKKDSRQAQTFQGKRKTAGGAR